MMRAMLIALFSVAGLSGCNSPEFQAMFGGPQPVVGPAEVAPAAATVAAAVVAPPPPPAARTAEEFDTTTAEQRAAAVATPVAASEARLGTTVASLGPPAEPGLWLRTGLVSETGMGRVENPATGKTVTLELRPSGGPATAGSQISLAAMRLLEVALTALPELVVYRQ